MLAAWSTGYGSAELASPFGAAGSPSQKQCERLTRRYERTVDRYDRQGGRRFLGIRVGSGDRRLSKLESKLESACARAAAQDPNLAFEQGWQQAQMMMPTPTTGLEAPDTDNTLTIAALIGVVVLGIGGLAAFAGGGR